MAQRGHIDYGVHMSVPRRSVTEIPKAERDRSLRMSCARCGSHSRFKHFAATNRWCRSCGIWFHKDCSSHVMGKPHCPVCRGKIRRIFNPLLTIIAVMMILLAVVMVVDAAPKTMDIYRLVNMDTSDIIVVDDMEEGTLLRIEGEVRCPATAQGCVAIDVDRAYGSVLAGDASSKVTVNDFDVCDGTACVEIWSEKLELGMDVFVYDGPHGGKYKDGDKIIIWGKTRMTSSSRNAIKLTNVAPSIDTVNADLAVYIGLAIGGLVILGISIVVIARQITGLSDLDRHERYMRNVKLAPKAEAPVKPPGWKGIYHDGETEE